MQSVSNRMILSLWHTHSMALLLGLIAHELMTPSVSGHDKSLIQMARVAPSGPHVSTLLRHDATAPLISIHWRCCKSVAPPLPFYEDRMHNYEYLPGVILCNAPEN